MAKMQLGNCAMEMGFWKRIGWVLAGIDKNDVFLLVFC